MTVLMMMLMKNDGFRQLFTHLVSLLFSPFSHRHKVGSAYSAAVTSSGELYTWGKGTYGRLGHGSSDDHTHPTLVNALKGHHVTYVACGYGDAQTLAATDKGSTCFI